MTAIEVSPIVDAKGLTKSFRSGEVTIKPVNGLNLQVTPGELVALMGPSGSGKSTLLNLIGGLDQPDAGTCVVAGQDIARLSDRARTAFRASHIGFVFQSFNLIPILSAAENVELPLRLKRLSRKRRAMQAALALEIVGLSDRAQHRPSQLSGGQRQRVAIARALATDPALILADEPTGNLDEEAGEQIMDVLTSLARDHAKTIVMVTHDPSKAERATRTLRLRAGRVDGVERAHDGGDT
ncbi:MAG: ABC transporter ATP-binding protein [Sandaracinaceae bacterium]